MKTLTEWSFVIGFAFIASLVGAVIESRYGKIAAIAFPWGVLTVLLVLLRSNREP